MLVDNSVTQCLKTWLELNIYAELTEVDNKTIFQTASLLCPNRNRIKNTRATISCNIMQYRYSIYTTMPNKTPLQ